MVTHLHDNLWSRVLEIYQTQSERCFRLSPMQVCLELPTQGFTQWIRQSAFFIFKNASFVSKNHQYEIQIIQCTLTVATLHMIVAIHMITSAFSDVPHVVFPISGLQDFLFSRDLTIPHSVSARALPVSRTSFTYFGVHTFLSTGGIHLLS